ncbi:protein ABHD14A-like [Oncorhynchus nerka]|uniref:protein ABHD14A-like n=1 Tax=Oncorhynchus nerka TaxID=8023 RepID=UPI00113209C1|nr:protein ABHD14A-like [Oncorhynchus nerka]
MVQHRVDLLGRFMETLGVRTMVLLSPSMSGHCSIPFLTKHSAQLHGFIPIAPVGTRNYTPQQYQGIQARTAMLDVWTHTLCSEHWTPTWGPSPTRTSCSSYTTQS